MRTVKCLGTGILATIALYEDKPEYLAVFASLSYGAVAALMELRKANRDKRAASHATYLLDLEERFARDGKIYNFQYMMDQFIND